MNKTKLNDGGPAFSRPIGHHPSSGCCYSEGERGMSLRDYFAAQALAAVAHKPHDYFTGIKSMTAYCYRMADAMLEQRKEINS